MNDISQKSRGGRPALPPDEKAQSLHVKLHPGLLKALRARAAVEGVSQARIITRALLAYFNAPNP